ncbi:MAG: type II toxin-antitoxin system HicB family antitoxin [Candidatus Acidiferrales bacterium]
MQREFTAIIEKKGRWYIGTIEEIPGVNTQGRTLSEVRRNLREAIELIVVSNRLLASKEHTSQAKREPITVRV